MIPKNEAETIELFKALQNHLGWRIVHLQQKFPDAKIEHQNGMRLIAEFEYRAKNFLMHRHPFDCDIIICWHNDWFDAPIPIWALEDCLHIIAPETFSALQVRKMRKLERHVKELESELYYFRRELSRAGEILKAVEQKLHSAEFVRDYGRVKIVGAHDLKGVGKLYTTNVRTYESVTRFFSEIFALSEVRDIQDIWIERANLVKTGPRPNDHIHPTSLPPSTTWADNQPETEQTQ